MSQQSLRSLPQIALLALALLISVFVAACSKSANTGNSNNTSNTSSPTTGMSPTDAVRGYFEAAFRKDVEAVKKYISQATYKLMEDEAKARGKTFEQMVKESREEQIMPQFSNETISGDTATVDLSAPSRPTIKMPLVKEGGQWKLALDKLLDDMKAGAPGKGGAEEEDDHGKH